MIVIEEWKERAIHRTRRSIGWDNTAVYKASGEFDTNDEISTAEDAEDVRIALERLNDPNRSTTSLEDVKRDLGF